MNWKKLITLDNCFQADLPTEALEKAGIPFLVREYKDTDYNGLFVTQKGWGTVMLEGSGSISQELFSDRLTSAHEYQ